MTENEIINFIDKCSSRQNYKQLNQGEVDTAIDCLHSQNSDDEMSRELIYLLTKGSKNNNLNLTQIQLDKILTTVDIAYKQYSQAWWIEELVLYFYGNYAPNESTKKWYELLLKATDISLDYFSSHAFYLALKKVINLVENTTIPADYQALFWLQLRRVFFSSSLYSLDNDFIVIPEYELFNDKIFQGFHLLSKLLTGTNDNDAWGKVRSEKGGCDLYQKVDEMIKGKIDFK